MVRFPQELLYTLFTPEPVGRSRNPTCFFFGSYRLACKLFERTSNQPWCVEEKPIKHSRGPTRPLFLFPPLFILPS
jgi:hypothetical protein